MSHIVPTNGSGKQTVSKPLTTKMLLKGKGKSCLITAESNPGVCDDKKKTGCMTYTKTEISENGSMTKADSSCQKNFKVSHTQEKFKETAISDDSFTKQRVANEVAPKELSAQPSTSEHMARFHVGFISECGGQKSLRKELSLKETEKMQEKRVLTVRVVKQDEMLNKREESVANFSEGQIGREKIQKQRVASLSKVRVEQAGLKEKEKKRETAINEEGVRSDEDGQKRKKEEKEAAMSEKKRVKRKKERDKDDVLKEGEVTLLGKDKVEREKQTTVKGNGKVRSERADLWQDKTKIEMQNRDKEKERDKKGVGLHTITLEQEPPAHDEGKKSLTTPTGNPNISDESKMTGTEIQTRNKNGNNKVITSTASRCQFEVEVLKVSDTKERLKKTADSDISSTKHKAASEIAPNKITTQHTTDEHMAEFLVSFINECGGGIRPATLMKEVPVKEEDKMQERGAALNEKERVEVMKVASLNVKEKERVERRKKEKDKVQKKREGVVLCENMRVEGEKATTLKETKRMKREQKAKIGEEDQQREKRKARRYKKERNELEKKEATLTATTSEQEPSTQTGTAGAETSEGGSVVLVSQIVLTNGNGKQAFCKSVAASMGTQLSECQEKRSLIVGIGNASVPDERKKTFPETQMQGNSITESVAVTASRCQSEVEVLKMSVTKERLKEMSVSDISSTKHIPPSEIASNTAQHSTGEHMAACLVGFINECGGQTRPGTLMKDTPPKEKDKMQEEKETALSEKERTEIKIKKATLKGDGKLKTKEEDLMEDKTKREKQRKRQNKKVKKKRAALAATNLEQEPPAHSGITEPKGRLIVSVSQIVPTNGNSRQTTSDPLTAPNGTNLCKHQEKSSCATATTNCNIPDESKKSGPETHMRTEISEKDNTEAVTESANRCKSEVEVLKVSQRTNLLKETSVSDISSTKQKSTSKVTQNKLSAELGTCEHIAQFPVGSIIECGGQTKLATLREEAPLREKGRVHKEREAALNEKEKVEPKKEASVKVKEKERVERRKEEKDKVQKEREEVVLCEKVRVEGEKTTALKDTKTVKREQKAGIKEKDQQREKRMASKREKNEREKKEATLAATTSEQEPSTQIGTARPETSEGGSLVLASQIVPTNGKQAVCKPVAASMGTQLSEKWSLITGKDNTTVPEERKNTIPKTQILENVSANRGQSAVGALKVTHTKKPLKETVVSDSSSTKHKTASKVASQRIPAQPGTSEHMAQFLVDFINVCGGQTRLATLKKEAFRQYQEKYYGQYTYLSKGFLRQYDCFEIFDDSSGVCHVRVVGAQRQSLAHTEPEKMEHKTKKILFYKPVCDIKVRYTSKDKVVSGSDFASFPGSPEHIVEYLHHYLSSHPFPYGCPVSSLDELYQKEYRPRYDHPVVPMINARFLKEFSNYFVLQDGRTFVKLKEGVDHSDTSQLKGCPYTAQHVNDYFRRYLAKEGVVCTQQLQVLFGVCYMKEFKMPQKPIIQFVQNDFFKQSRHLFVTFVDTVVFRK